MLLLLSCSTAHAHAIAVRPRDVKIRGIAAPVRIYEAESQDAALDAAIETDSDPFGACCWPSAVVAARAISHMHLERVVRLFAVVEKGPCFGKGFRVGIDLFADISEPLERIAFVRADM